MSAEDRNAKKAEEKAKGFRKIAYLCRHIIAITPNDDTVVYHLVKSS